VYVHCWDGIRRTGPAVGCCLARHDLWRRKVCDSIIGLLVRGLIDHEDAEAMEYDCCNDPAKQVYTLR
jgi:hypothetical protein